MNNLDINILGNISHTNNNSTDTSDIIRQQLEYLFEPGDVFEMTAFDFNVNKHHLWDEQWTSGSTITGFFDNFEKAIKTAQELDQNIQPESINISLNPVNPELLGRANNRLKAIKNGKTIRPSDKDILHRKHLFVDIDPVKTSGVSAKDEQVQAAEDVAVQIIERSEILNLPKPLQAHSGNGIHLLFKVDLQNSPESTTMVESFTQSLKEEFDNADITIDTKVTNPSRLIKVYGTHARKGDPTPEQPHRLATIDSVPPNPGAISRIFLEQVVASRQQKQPETNTLSSVISIGTGTIPKLDIPKYLAYYNINVVDIKQHGGATFYCIDTCLFNPNHQNKAAICISENVTIFYKCFHNSCSAHTWDEARQLISGNDSLAPFLEGFEGEYEPILGTQLTGSDILNLDLPPVHDLIERMIGQEETTIISGPAGIGKSVLTMNVALSLGSPSISKLWGLDIRDEVKTLFFQSENGTRATRNRLQLLNNDRFLSNGIKNILFPSFGTDDIRASKGYFSDPVFIDLMIHHIEMSGAQLLVIDPLISFSGVDENDNTEMRRSLDNLNEVIIKTKCSILLIHHVGKIYSANRTSFSGRGATSIGDYADNNYLFERKFQQGVGNILKLSNQKTRNAGQVDDMELIMDNNLVLHRLQQNTNSKAISKHNIVVQALTELSGRVMKQKDLIDKIADISGKSMSVSRTMLLDAVEEGYVLTGDEDGLHQNKIFRLP